MRATFRFLALPALLFLAASFCPAQQSMNNDAVIRLAKSGLSEDLIVQTITASPGQYKTGTDDLIALKTAGVTDKEIGAMLTKNANPNGAPAAAALASSAIAALPPGVTDVGVYSQDKAGQWNDVLSEVVNYKTGGVLKGFASGGLVKGDLNGNVAGKESRLKLQSPASFIIYVMEGQSPTEYQLLRLHSNNDSREFRSKTGGVVHQSTGASRDLIEFEAKKIAPRVYQITIPASTGRGEYGFLPPGTMNSQNSAASSGKIYSFSLVE